MIARRARRIDRHASVCRIVGVVDNAVDDCRVVLAYRDDETTARQFILTEMDLAAGADLHRRRPRKAERAHVVLEPFAPDVDAAPSGCRSLTALPGALRASASSERRVDLGIRET